MKLRRVLVVSLAAALLATGMWVAGGDAWAARREARCEKEWAATFGSLEDLKKRYPKREENEAAKRLEGLTRGSAFDLTPRVRNSASALRAAPQAEAKESQAMFDYVLAEIGRSEAGIDAPSEAAALFLEEKRALLDVIESTLLAPPGPQWSADINLPEWESPQPNLLGHMRLQRILMARALAAAQAVRYDLAARSLEASWNLNESLRGRAEMPASIMGIAIARLEAGVLRKVNVEERLWRQRLTSFDPRRSLLYAFVLDSRLMLSRTWRRSVSKGAGSPWYQRARDFLASPINRVAMVEYSNLMRDELARLREAPLSDHFPDPRTPDVRDTAHILATISMPNTRNSFVRADRLVVDAELTSKILEAKQLRRENGMRWPAAIPGIEKSRFPGASWRYEVSPDGRLMSIAFSRELASPYGQNGMKPLPLRFSSN